MEQLDYPAAADRLLTVLAHLERKVGPSPVRASALCLHVFRAQYHHWTHETRRRRIREAVPIARRLLRERRESVVLAGGAEGYYLTGDATTIAAYAARRRRHGLQALVAASQTAHSPAAATAAGQADLFPSRDREGATQGGFA